MCNNLENKLQRSERDKKTITYIKTEYIATKSNLTEYKFHHLSKLALSTKIYAYFM